MEVPGNPGHEDAVISCCEEHQRWTWIPFKNDCHSVISRCLQQAGIPPVPAPGGRLGNRCGKPECTPGPAASRTLGSILNMTLTGINNWGGMEYYRITGFIRWLVQPHLYPARWWYLPFFLASGGLGLWAMADSGWTDAWPYVLLPS